MLKINRLGKVLVQSASVLLLYLGMGTASAANVAVVCVDQSTEGGVASALSERLRHVMVKHGFQGRYDHFEMLSCRTASDERVLVERLSGFSRSHRTDFLDLRVHPESASFAAFSRALQADLALQTSAGFPKLRWVHASLREGVPNDIALAWLRAGARSVSVRVLASSEVEDRAFMAELLDHWVQGKWLTESASKANAAVIRFSGALAPWLSRARTGTVSGLHLFGQDVRQLDLNTRELGPSGRVWFRSADAQVLPKVLKSQPSESEVSGVQFYGALILPGAPLLPSVGGVTELIERASGPAWDLLRSSFPDPVPAVPGRIGDTQEGELSWVDGDGLRYFLKPLQAWLGDGTNQFLQGILGLRLQRRDVGLHTAFHLKRAMTLSLAQSGVEIPDGEVESLHLPRTLRLAVRIVKGVADVQFLPVVDEPLSIDISWNGVPLSVVPTLARADLSTGDAQIEATVLGGLLSFVAKVNFYEKRFGGIDLWESIDRNLSRFELPKIRFTQK